MLRCHFRHALALTMRTESHFGVHQGGSDGLQVRTLDGMNVVIPRRIRSVISEQSISGHPPGHGLAVICPEKGFETVPVSMFISPYPSSGWLIFCAVDWDVTHDNSSCSKVSCTCVLLLSLFSIDDSA